MKGQLFENCCCGDDTDVYSDEQVDIPPLVA